MQDDLARATGRPVGDDADRSVYARGAFALGAVLVALLFGGALLADPAAAQSRDRFTGTKGAYTTSAATPKKAEKAAKKKRRGRKRRHRRSHAAKPKPLVAAVSVFNESRSGLGARLAAHIRTRLEKLGIRLDPNAPTLLIVRAGIQSSANGQGGLNDGVSLSNNGQASLHAQALWRHPENRGIIRGTNAEPDQIDGASVSLRVRNLLRQVRRLRGSLYTVHLQLEQPGKPPLWQGTAITKGKSIDPDGALRDMADALLKNLGKSAAQTAITTR